MNICDLIFVDWCVWQVMIEVFNYCFMNMMLLGGKDFWIISYFLNFELVMQFGFVMGCEVELLELFKVDLLFGMLEGYVLLLGGDCVIDRKGICVVLDLLYQVGWMVQDGVLCNDKGQFFVFEILLNQLGSVMCFFVEVWQMVNIFVELL